MVFFDSKIHKFEDLETKLAFTHSQWLWNGSTGAWSTYSSMAENVRIMTKDPSIKAMDSLNLSRQSLWIYAVEDMQVTLQWSEIDAVVSELSDIKAGWHFTAVGGSSATSMEALAEQNDAIYTLWRLNGDHWDVYVVDEALRAEVKEEGGMKLIEGSTTLQPTDIIWIQVQGDIQDEADAATMRVLETPPTF